MRAGTSVYLLSVARSSILNSSISRSRSRSKSASRAQAVLVENHDGVDCAEGVLNHLRAPVLAPLEGMGLPFVCPIVGRLSLARHQPALRRIGVTTPAGTGLARPLPGRQNNVVRLRSEPPTIAGAAGTGSRPTPISRAVGCLPVIGGTLGLAS